VVRKGYLGRVDWNDPAGLYDKGNRISQAVLLWK
jgi:hypothetical protein